jgi:hypothetical protein
MIEEAEGDNRGLAFARMVNNARGHNEDRVSRHTVILCENLRAELNCAGTSLEGGITSRDAFSIHSQI